MLDPKKFWSWDPPKNRPTAHQNGRARAAGQPKVFRQFSIKGSPWLVHSSVSVWTLVPKVSIEHLSENDQIKISTGRFWNKVTIV